MRATLERGSFQQGFLKQPKPHWALDPDCVLYLPFWNMPDGTVFLSQDAYGHTSTRTSATPNGQGGWTFDGVDDKIVVTNAASLNMVAALSILVWVKRTGASSGGGVLDKYVLDPASGWNMAIWNTVMYFYLFDSLGSNNVRTSSGVVVDVWVHFAVTFDGSTLKTFINGVEANTGAQLDSVANTNDVIIGNAKDGWGYLPGVVGSVALLNRSLSVKEIWDNFQLTRGQYGI